MTGATLMRRASWEIIHWAARVTAALSVGLILLFFVGTGFSPTQVTSREGLLLLFFPAGVAIGMVLGWRREGLGGAVTVLSLAGFYATHYFESGRMPVGPWFALLSLPGLLFLISYSMRPKNGRPRRTP